MNKHIVSLDIYREVPDRRRECLFYLALGHFKLGNYNDARKFNDSLLDFEPNNSQARALRQEIDDRVAKGMKDRYCSPLAFIRWPPTILTKTLFFSYS